MPPRAIDVYRTLRFEYAALVVRPAIADAWKVTTSRHAANDLVAKRADVQRDFESAIGQRIARFGPTPFLGGAIDPHRGECEREKW